MKVNGFSTIILSPKRKRLRESKPSRLGSNQIVTMVGACNDNS